MIETERLLLRPWREADRGPWIAMMTDPAVGYWLGGPFDAAAAGERFDEAKGFVERDGYGFWAAERLADGALIGSVGVRLRPADWAVFAGAVEAGWRLVPAAWGLGYAAEGAAAALAWAWLNLEVEEIVAFTATSNAASQAVMRRIGMERDPSRDFDHPALAEDHPLRRHLVFVARRPARHHW